MADPNPATKTCIRCKQAPRIEGRSYCHPCKLAIKTEWYWRTHTPKPPMVVDGKRHCHKCQQYLPLDQFFKNRSTASGFSSACKACNQSYARSPAAVRAAIDRYHARYPHLEKVRVIARKAVKDGHIAREPCVQCGNPQSEIHHPDYDYPLVVIWLCRTCHRALHYPREEA
jgi:hypothetical protein